MKNKTIVLIFIFFAGFSDLCFAQKPTQEDEIKAKELKAPPDKALVYVVRPSKSAFAVVFSIKCDEVPMVDLPAGHFVFFYVTPGKHLLSAKTEKQTELELVTEAGKIYFLEAVISMGWVVARVGLKSLNDQDGAKKLNKCKLSPDNMKHFIE